MDTVSATQEDTMTLVDDEGVGCTVAISAQQEQRVNPRTMAVISHVVELDGASREDGGADNYYTVDVTLAGVDLKRYSTRRLWYCHYHTILLNNHMRSV